MDYIGNKKFLFKTSLLVDAAEVAVVKPESARGRTFRITISTLNTPMETFANGLPTSVVGDEINITMPFLQNGNTLSNSFQVTDNTGALGVRLAASCVGDYMLVHLHCYEVEIS